MPDHFIKESAGLLERLYQLEFFSDLDYYFALSMQHIAGEFDEWVLISCALLSKVLSQGHVCIDIMKMGNSRISVPGAEAVQVRLPEKTAWMQKLKKSELVSDGTQTPLVLDNSGNLYLAKYYDFQLRLAQNIVTRLTGIEGQKGQPVFEPDKNTLDKLFTSGAKGIKAQREAVSGAVQNAFTIICGGPGTGKTFVSNAIKKIFTKSFYPVFNREPVILSVAPTGKAASKMDQGRTIHSVLKPYRNRPGFRFNRKNQLTADAVIIDEASMIDLVLLTRLLEAIPFNARVILMGDRHQLASVQAGAVFSDICQSKEVAPQVHELTHNFRSGTDSGIHQLAGAVKNNEFDKVKSLFYDENIPDVVFCPLSGERDLHYLLVPYIVRGYGPIQDEPVPENALAFMDRFKILCAHNKGEYGTLQINHLCENVLRNHVNSDIQNRLFKRVVMVNVNDYAMGLFNGDTGIVASHGENHLFFLKPVDSSMRQLAYSRLPSNETAFAITVHKSQGSEFSTVLLLIPEKISPVLTRRLLYTGITRTKKKLIVAGDIKMIQTAMNQDTQRYSGLDRLLAQKL